MPIFSRYLWLKNKFAKKAATKREKIILTFTNRYVIHLIIIVIALGVATANLLAYENRENYGQNALIYKIIGLENIEVIEDVAAISEEPQVYSYLSGSAQLGSESYTETQKEEEAYQLEPELATTHGGSTLVKPELASTEAAKITRTSIRKYTVEEGDTIGEIAVMFNISVNTILWANNLSFSTYIKPGQELTILPITGVIHLIKKGDTLASIAKKYDASEAKIKEFNNIGSDELLVVGETIMAPGGRIIYTARPRDYTAYVTAPAYSTPTVATGGKMYWPSTCRRITQYFRGWRHTGIDIACGWSKPVRAAEAGVVSRVQYARYGYGYNVTIDHGGGKKTLYAHLGRIEVKVGDEISKAQVIALEGSTGRSTGPHLHFEVIISGSKINPLNYVR